MNKIAFVIPVHNRLKYTQECLDILSGQQASLFFKNNEISIIVTDDGSTDGTAEWISENHPNVIVLRGDGNLWFAGSMNMGMKYAFEILNCDFIMVWENDIYPVNNYFDHLQDILERWDRSSVICSKMYFKAQPDIIFGMGGTFNPRTGFRSLIGRMEKDGPEFEKEMEVDWFLGQGVLIHREIVDKAGYFDEVHFPQYSADLDYSIRIKWAGYPIIAYPDLKLLNDTETTGLSHIPDKSIGQFIESLFSIRSNMNIRKDLVFNRLHANSPSAYWILVKKYFIYFGSFIKWKMLGLIGIKRKEKDLF